MKITKYLGEGRDRADRELLEALKRVANTFAIQYALLWYIYLRNYVSLQELYRTYRFLSGKMVRENTVRKQLQMLERKGLTDYKAKGIFYLKRIKAI